MKQWTLVRIIHEKFTAPWNSRGRAAMITIVVSATSSGGALGRFLEPQKAITPGQSAVFYSEDEVLGGGIIEQVLS